MRISTAAGSEAAFHVCFGVITIRLLSSEKVDLIHGIMDLSLVQIVVKDIFADFGIFITNNRRSP